MITNDIEADTGGIKMTRRGKKAFALSIAMLLAFNIVAFAADNNSTTPSLTITVSSKTKENVPTDSIVQEENKLDNQIEAGKTTLVKAGQLFYIVLEDNTATDYAWTYNMDGKAAKFLKLSDRNPDSNNIIAGAPVNKVFAFKALRKGTVKLTFYYVNALENDGKPIKTMIYTVKVK